MAAKKGKNEIALWDEQLAQYAEKQASQEQVKGKWFSLQSGQLSFNDAPVPGNKMGVIIIDNVFENAFYPGKFTPGAIVPPDCFAFAREEGDLKPHELSSDPQHTDCATCPMNAWGSADTGRGKACGNRRRLALIPAGTYDKAGDFEAIFDAAHYATADLGFLKLPSTSIKGWAGYVKQIAQMWKRPPFAVITEIHVVPDADTQFKVNFTALHNIKENDLLQAIVERHKAMEASNEIAFPYEPVTEEQTARNAAPRGNAKAAKHSSRAAPVKTPATPKVKAPATPAPKVKAPVVKAAKNKPAEY